jgi:predicted DNA-binding transcriptional regulator AlpA
VSQSEFRRRTAATVVEVAAVKPKRPVVKRRTTQPQRRAPMRPIAAHDGDELPRQPTSLRRMLGKAEVCRLCGVTYSTIWWWMQNGTFPRSRAVGNKSVWAEDEIAEWLANRPLVRLKCDKAGEVEHERK